MSTSSLVPLVVLEDVWKSYELGEVTITVLKGINLSIYSGEFVMVMGPSGSGKSTLLSLIGGLEKPDRGTIRIVGENITRYSNGKLKDYRRRQVGFVFQFYSLVPTLTALENVSMMLELLGKGSGKKVETISRQMLELVGLGHRLQNYPSQLSGGERQRVAIARALAKQPPLLLCDEPTGQLDAKTGQEITELIRIVTKRLQMTTIMVTHDVSLMRHADRVVQLRDGIIVSDLRPQGGFCS